MEDSIYLLLVMVLGAAGIIVLATERYEEHICNDTEENKKRWESIVENAIVVIDGEAYVLIDVPTVNHDWTVYQARAYARDSYLKSRHTPPPSIVICWDVIRIDTQDDSNNCNWNNPWVV